MVGGFASSRAHVASSVGASASSTIVSPPDSTHVEVTGALQFTLADQSGCAVRQIQRPGARSTISLTRLRLRPRRVARRLTRVRATSDTTKWDQNATKALRTESACGVAAL